MLTFDAQGHGAPQGRGQEGYADFRGNGFRGDIAAPASTGTSFAAGRPAKGTVARAAKQLTNDFLRLGRIHAPRAGKTATPLKGGPARTMARSHLWAFETELIVLRSFGLVTDDVVGVLDFLEADFGLLVAGVAVRMIFT